MLAKTSMGIGALLVVLGVGVYGTLAATGDESPSVTALIPAFFGLPIVICGALALKDSLRMHAMHGVATLGLLGVVLPVLRLVMQVVSGKLALTIATFSLLAMAGLSLALLVLCVRSFIAARRAREASEKSGSAG